MLVLLLLVLVMRTLIQLDWWLFLQGSELQHGRRADSWQVDAGRCTGGHRHPCAVLLEGG
jgi:hypothetical protein